MEALLASLGTLLVVAGYMLVKRLARSRCQVDSGCMQCDSPAVELAKKHTERLDEIFEMIKQVRPELQAGAAVHAARAVVPVLLRDVHLRGQTQVHKEQEKSQPGHQTLQFVAGVLQCRSNLVAPTIFGFQNRLTLLFQTLHVFL